MTPHRMCAGKHRYSAATARAQAARERDHNATASEAYRCTECGSWHVGSPMTMPALQRRAAEVRARTGNAPGFTCTGCHTRFDHADQYAAHQCGRKDPPPCR